MVYCQVVGATASETSAIEALPHEQAAKFFEGRASCLAGPAAARLTEMGYSSLPVLAPGSHSECRDAWQQLRAILTQLATCLRPIIFGPPTPSRKQDMLLPGKTIDIFLASACDASMLAALHSAALPPGWPPETFASYCEVFELHCSESSVRRGDLRPCCLAICCGRSRTAGHRGSRGQARPRSWLSLFCARLSACAGKMEATTFTLRWAKITPRPADFTRSLGSKPQAAAQITIDRILQIPKPLSS